MACRCGKTRVAHGIMNEYLGREGPPRVLYLVPGLALLRQTAQKLDGYGTDAAVLLVGSDDRPLPVFQTLRALEDRSTTSPALIARAFEADAPLLVVSTYQSSALLPDAFDLTVFDESHRVCGDRSPRPFTHTLLENERGDRLYMTATPRYDAPVSMKDRELFGSVAYAYHMRDGIDAGYVNDFGLELVGRAREAGVDDRVATAGQVVAALERLCATLESGKLLVFCRDIAHASALCVEVGGALAGTPLEGTPCLCAHSRMGRGEISGNLARFCAPRRARRSL